MEQVGKGEVSTFLDVANVAIDNPKLRGKGHFKEFVDHALKLLSDPELRRDLRGIYVENVMTPKFEDGLKRMGFQLVKNSLPHSYVLKVC